MISKVKGHIRFLSMELKKLFHVYWKVWNGVQCFLEQRYYQIPFNNSAFAKDTIIYEIPCEPVNDFCLCSFVNLVHSKLRYNNEDIYLGIWWRCFKLLLLYSITKGKSSSWHGTDKCILLLSGWQSLLYEMNNKPSMYHVAKLTEL